MNAEQYENVAQGTGFVAALDQSGGSTPKALSTYGIEEDAYSNDGEMFDLVHQMRTRIISSPSFDGNRVLGAILFENTMDRTIVDRPSAEYLWIVKGIVPFLKIDRGLEKSHGGAQIMKPIPDLPALLSRALHHGIFGTKMRSFITLPGAGVDDVVEQQFAIARQILPTGLVPILEMEVDIHSSRKADAEASLAAALLASLDKLGADEQVLLKLTLPEIDNAYWQFVEHPRVLRVLALSGGYTRKDADDRLVRNNGVIASFSRALTEGLTAQQGAADFDRTLDESIDEIAAASRA